MAGFGLLLGGGGSVGVAWENGVLAGLVDAIGFEPARSRIIVGTSAGSAVGADMALGKDPHDALALDGAGDNPRQRLPPHDLESGAFSEIIATQVLHSGGWHPARPRRGFVVRRPELLPGSVTRGRALHGRRARPPLPHAHREADRTRCSALPRVSEMLVEDMAALAATGVRVHTILGSEGLDALGPNLMDYSKRPDAFACGLVDGAAHAPAVAELLG